MTLLPRLLLLCGLLFAAPVHAQERVQDALDAVNHYRASVGLPPVVLDDRMSRACEEHTRYLVLNDGRPELEGLKAHNQDPRLPGASPAGAWCGKNADLYQHVGSPLAAVHAWMNSLYHRTPLLSPSLRRVGIAETLHPGGGVAAALMFDDEPAAVAAWPIRYPAPEQIDVPLEFIGEVPNPVPKDGRSGYPITLHFPANAKVGSVEAHLFDASGTELSLHVSHPGRPAHKFPQGGAVCLLPKSALQPGVRHRVRVRLEWQDEPRDYDWSFTTAYPVVLEPQERAALRSREELPALVRGRVLSTWRTDDGRLVCLQLSRDAPQQVTACVVDGEFRRVAGRTAPAAFEGQTVQVLATLQDRRGDLGMTVHEAWQLWFPPQDERPLLDAADPAILAAHVGLRVRVRGVLTGGGAVTQGTDIYLQLNDRTLDVFASAPLWSAIAGGRPPKLLLGHPIEVEAVLGRGGDQLKVTLADAAQLRLLPLGDLPVVNAADAAALKDAVGRRVKVRGRLTGGGQVSDGTGLYLQLNDRALVAFVPQGVWRTVARGREPSFLLGHPIEIEALVEAWQDHVQAHVQEAAQLRLLPLGDLPAVNAADAAALKDAVGQRVKVRGRLTGGGQVSDGTGLYLQLNDRALVAFVPQGVWRTVARGREPSFLLGHPIEIEALVEAWQDRVQAHIQEAAQLRLLPLGDLPALDAADPVAMKGAIGQRVKVRGRLTQGGQVDKGTDLYLDLNHSGLVVFISPGIWQAVAGARTPSRLLGHVIEVEAFVVQHGDQLQATVVDSSQLRLIPLGELPVLRPTETAALRRARDQLVVVTGKVSHADYFEDSKDVYLVLEGPPRDSVFLAIKAEEWSRLAGSAAPSTFVGRQLQAQVVPQPEARELRLQVADADALKVVRD